MIDAHQHLWDPARRAYTWMTDDVAPLRRAFDVAALRAVLPEGVTATIAVQAASVHDETEELLRVADGRPIAGVVGWVDLTGDVDRQIARLRGSADARRLVGLRHQVHDEADPQWLLRDDVVRGLRAVARAHLPFDLLVRQREMPAAIETARALPHLQFVLDHAGKPPIADGGWEPWASSIATMAELPNVVCKLSGLVTEAGSSWRDTVIRYAGRVLEAFGARRVLFGSDWPVCTLAASYAEVFALARRMVSDASDDERAAFFGGNARRIYRLEGLAA